MTDEEKKEYIEHEILDRLYCLEENDFDKNKVDDGYIQAVLNACKEAKNLIEKQFKEIEEYKKQLDLDYVDKHFVPVERYNQLEKEIEELKNKNKKLKDKAKELIFEKQELTSALLDSTPNDKIKAKIEELKEDIKYSANPLSIDNSKFGIKVLQSLLEKE